MKSIKFIFFLASAVSLFSFSYFDSSDPQITKDEIYEHVKYLSSEDLEGRFPGTEGDRMASGYISDQYKEYGLTSLMGGSYLQEFPIVTDVKLGNINIYKIKDGSKTTPFDIDSDFKPYAFSANGKAKGDLVFVGYGITAPEANYDDYKDKNGNDLNVEGKILIMIRNSPNASDPHDNTFSKYEPARYKADLAQGKKAAGIIFINGYELGDEDKLIALMYDRSLQDEGLQVINAKRETLENVFSSRNLDLKKTIENINSSKKPNSFALTNSSAEIHTTVKPVSVTTTNIAGFIEGSDPVLKNEVIVIGAHYDHLGYGTYGSLYTGKEKKIHYGADDNASGTAGVLELAEKFSSEKANLKRSFLFICFGAEEAGLLGSKFFTDSPEFKHLNVTAMINMDMIGRMDAKKLIVYGTGTSPSWEPQIKELNTKYNFNITYTPDGYGPSDHSMFYLKDIPVLHFFTGSHSDYHSPTDTYDKLNYNDEVSILNMIYDVSKFVNTSTSKLEFTKPVTSNQDNKMAKFTVSLGTIPDYSYSDKGLKISGVRSGGPAEKAGLQSGDIIIKLGSKEIGNIYDYMSALAEHKANEEVELLVIRNGEEMTFKAVLEGR